MSFTEQQAREMQERLERKRKKPDLKPQGVDEEIPLHSEIIHWCKSQWPRVMYTHANPAAKSTIAKGHCDFVLFLPIGRTVCIECKDKDGKLRLDQVSWAVEMKRNGHTVFICRSMAQFEGIIRGDPNPEVVV